MLLRELRVTTPTPHLASASQTAEPLPYIQDHPEANQQAFLVAQYKSVPLPDPDPNDITLHADPRTGDQEEEAEPEAETDSQHHGQVREHPEVPDQAGTSHTTSHQGVQHAAAETVARGGPTQAT